MTPEEKHRYLRVIPHLFLLIDKQDSVVIRRTRAHSKAARILHAFSNIFTRDMHRIYVDLHFWTHCRPHTQSGSVDDGVNVFALKNFKTRSNLTVPVGARARALIASPLIIPNTMFHSPWLVSISIVCAGLTRSFSRNILSCLCSGTCTCVICAANLDHCCTSIFVNLTSTLILTFLTGEHDRDFVPVSALSRRSPLEMGARDPSGHSFSHPSFQPLFTLTPRHVTTTGRRDCGA